MAVGGGGKARSADVAADDDKCTAVHKISTDAIAVSIEVANALIIVKFASHIICESEGARIAAVSVLTMANIAASVEIRATCFA